MKFLITGGAGFIGSNYLNYAVNEYHNDYFVCLDNLTYAADLIYLKDIINYKNFKFIKGNTVVSVFADVLWSLFGVYRRRHQDGKTYDIV